MNNSDNKYNINKSDLIADELLASGVQVIESNKWNTGSTRGISFIFSNGNKFVVLNENLINGEKEKHLVIAHEREHIAHPSTFYNLDECPYSIYRKEYLVTKSLIRHLINEETLFKLIFINHYDNDALSDYFDVPVETIVKAINYYSELASWYKLKEKYRI